MQWYISYPVFFAGLVLGFDVLYPDHPPTPALNAELRAQSDDASPAPVVVQATDIPLLPQASRVAQFSPGLDRLAGVTPELSNSVLSYLTQAFSPSEAAPTPSPAEPKPIRLADWRSTVVRNDAVDHGAPEKPISRAALARDIQRELQRVGCYVGAIDGVWGKGSKRAALEFFDRVNATLPTQEPDVFTLSLVRAQSGSVCGSTCPRGQSLAGTGRCLPDTLVAQPHRGTLPPADAEGGWEPAVVAEASAARKPPPFGRMSIGGPKPDDLAPLSPDGQSRSASPRSGFAQTAALEDRDLGAGRGAPETLAVSSFDTDEVPAADAPKRVRASGASRAKSSPPRAKRVNTYRHVQRLFTHPLGTM
jgi:hypothetical protein